MRLMQWQNSILHRKIKEEGSFDIESDIIPFLSTLKGFKFGFNSGMRAEVLFVNTKEFTVKWGTKNPISIPTQSAATPQQEFQHPYHHGQP